MSASQLSITTLRELLLNQKEGDKLDYEFGEIIRGEYSNAFDSIARRGDLNHIITVVHAALTVRPERFSEILALVKHYSSGDVTNRVGKERFFAYAIGILKSAATLNKASALTKSDEEVFITVLLWTLEQGGVEGKVCLESQLSQEMAHYLSGDALNVIKRRQLHALTRAFLNKNWATDAKDAEGTFIKKFVDELTFKYWASMSHAARLKLMEYKTE